MRPGAKCTSISKPASLAAFSTAAEPASTIRSASDTFLPDVPAGSSREPAAPSPARTARWPPSSSAAARRIRAPLAPPRLSVPRKLDADDHAVLTSCGTVSPESSTLAFSALMSASSISSPFDGGNRVLPQLRLGDPRAEVAADRTHVAVQQLVPGLGERLVQLLGMVEPAPGDLAVDGVDPHRDVGDQHRRLALRAAERIRDRSPRRPWPRTATRRRGSWSAPTRCRRGSPGSALLHCVGVFVQTTSRPLVIVSPALPEPNGHFQPRPCCSIGSALGLGADMPSSDPRRGSCRGCGHRRSARRSPRRSSPSGRTSRGCRARRPADPACLRGLRD